MLLSSGFISRGVAGTLRQQLRAKCPPTPGTDKINKDNAATYNDYLFSACTAAGNCDTVPAPPADPATAAILSMTDGCGAWSIGSGSAVWAWQVWGWQGEWPVLGRVQWLTAAGAASVST